MVVIRRNMYNPQKDVSAICKDNSGSNTDGYGIAADIGTTTIAISLFSLVNNKCFGNVTENNSQTELGADVMMRIMHANMGKGIQLQSMITSQIEDMAGRISEGICNVGDIKKMVVTGNTTMCHLFLGRDLSGMAGAPFKPAYKGSVDITGKDIGFRKYPDIKIHVMPGVAAHVGADAVSALCSLELYSTDKIQLAIDIGTNAEIILNNKGRIYACSAAAGPAFEGQGIKCGIRACKGAVNGIKISRTTGNIVLDVIDTDKLESGINKEELIPKGICGSGIVDAIAELLKAGVLKPDGYLMGYEEALQSGIKPGIVQRIKKYKDRNCFVIYNKEINYTGYNGNKKETYNRPYEIIITQDDIRNIQLAKAAIQAAAEVLLEEAGVSLDNVDEVKIAGVFGKFIHPDAAVLFGLYPDIDKNKMEFVGNAAGNGAAQALVDNSFKELVLEYADKVEHIELAGRDSFQKKFLNAMEFKKWQTIYN